MERWPRCQGTLFLFCLSTFFYPLGPGAHHSLHSTDTTSTSNQYPSTAKHFHCSLGEVNITAALRSNSMTKVICIWPGSSHYQLPLLSLAWNWIGCGRQLKRDRESFTVTKQDLKLLLLPWKVPHYTDDVADFGNSLSHLNFPVLSATTEVIFLPAQTNWGNMFLAFYVHGH